MNLIGEPQMFCLKWDRDFIGKFLDYIYYDRDNSPRTYNNYLGFISIFSRYMIQKGHTKANPAEAFKKKPKNTKKRMVFTEGDLKMIFAKTKEDNFHFHTICSMIYFELTRRTEMTKLLVSDVNLFNRTINIRSEVSKNKKNQSVTIAKEFMPILAEHLAKAKNHYYLFSDNNFKPGTKQTEPKKLSDYWAKLRLKNKWRKEYQLYWQ